jgi:hypothetical protein
MWQLGPGWRDEAALAAAWRAATPFAHLIVDGLVDEARLDELMAIVDDEPVHAYEGEIFAFDATAPEPVTDGFRALRAEFAATFAPALARLTGKQVARVDMRGFAYGRGHHLLPHTDHQDGLGRALAYAYYLPTAAAPVGGELELYRCEQEAGGGALTVTEPAALIAPRANRLVVFDVGALTLHQVREVLAGLRLSLAGWFYP